MSKLEELLKKYDWQETDKEAFVQYYKNNQIYNSVGCLPPGEI